MLEPNPYWGKIDRIVHPEEPVEKYVFSNNDAVAESVLYRYPTYKERTVICCSTQSGCPVGCRFCGTGDYFVRNLTTDEIVSQSVHLLENIYNIEGTLASEIERLQIMFMSMGEPILNLKRMIEAIEILHAKYPNAALLVSTSGPRGKYKDLFEVASRIEGVGLQFSVHESTDEARGKLIPFKAKLTLKEISVKGLEFLEATGRKPFFNYCVHEGNNSPEDIARLVELFDPLKWEATVSVICEKDETMTAAHERQYELSTGFTNALASVGYSVRRFDPAGQSQGGGCGQLFYTQRWFAENPDKARASIGHGLPNLHADGELHLG